MCQWPDLRGDHVEENVRPKVSDIEHYRNPTLPAVFRCSSAQLHGGKGTQNHIGFGLRFGKNCKFFRYATGVGTAPQLLVASVPHFAKQLDL